MKTCYKCKEEKSLDQFGKKKNGKDGINGICKKCDAEQFRKYYADNKEKHKALVKKWKKEHPEPRQSERECLLCKITKNIKEYGGKDNLERICILCKQESAKPKTIFKPDVRICPCCGKEHNHKKENVCISCSGVYNRFKTKTYLASLLGSKCSNCGLDDIICLDFHHLNPAEKEFTICGDSVTNIEKLEKEVKKCILLCSHCHRKEHSMFQQKIIDYFERPIDLTKHRESKQEYKPLLHKRKYERPSKEELEKLIWTKPTTEIAKELGVSDKCIQKWCACYEIDKPPRGYWAKKKSKVMRNYISYDQTQKENENIFKG